MTHKSLLVSRAFTLNLPSSSSSRPISHDSRLLPIPSIPRSHALTLHTPNSTYSHSLHSSSFAAQLRSRNSRLSALPDDASGGPRGPGGSNSPGGGVGDGDGGDGAPGGGDKPSLLSCIVKKSVPMITLASSAWCVFWFYRIVMDCQSILEDSTLLYCLFAVLLSFDAFLTIFCIAMESLECIIFIALFCLIPIIALAYAIGIREDVSEEYIRSLPKYRFSQSHSLVMVDDNQLLNARRDSCIENRVCEFFLHPDDSECCICLSPYVDGAELYRLPCTHHFHCGCISRWLRTKATCPLCRFNILRGDTLV